MELLIILFLTLLNGIFAMSEMALASCRRVKLQKLADAGDRGARAALKLLDDPTQFLSSVQVGITSIGLLNGILGEAAFSVDLSVRMQGWGLDEGVSSVLATAVVVAIITYVTIVFGELVPKRIGQLFPEIVARAVALPMTAVAVAARPFVALLSGTTRAILAALRVNNGASQVMTEEEIEASLAEGLGAGVLLEHEHQMVRNVLELDKRPLASIMRPRDELVWLQVEDTPTLALQTVREYGHSWYPVCKGDLDQVEGVIHVESLLRLAESEPQATVGEHLVAAVYLPETLNAFEVLEQYRVSDMRVALVVDEYGVVQGLLTPRDLLEAITGELKSAEADDAWAIPDEDGTWQLDGGMPIAELKSRLDIEHLPDEAEGHYNTLAGLLLAEAGQMLSPHDVVQVGDWQFEVVRVDGHRIEEVRAKVLSADDIEGGANE
ncbi:MAG: Hemolysin [Pseudomonadota bacterium]